MRRPLRLLLTAVSLAAPVALPAARAQTLTDVTVPRFIEGINGTNANRVPYAYRVTLDGLTPSATYRYTNQVVIATDAATTSGAGNVIYATPGGFVRTSSPSLSSAGNYGEFTTDGGGSYTGWFVTEPTGNASRFAPGTEVFFRIALNNGAGGTAVVTRLTTTASATVASFGTTTTDGTAFYSDAEATPRNFVVLYDNVAGTGRPIAATFAEDDGSPNTTANSYAAFYATSVDGVAGAWGVLIPNTLPAGIRRIEQRTASGALAGAGTAGVATDADGVWPGADGIAGTADDVNTVNPSGGTATPLVLPSANAPLPVELSAFTAAADGQSAVLRWTTESETNNSGFAIETLRGNAWTELAFVAGRGTTSERMSYEQRIGGPRRRYAPVPPRPARPRRHRPHRGHRRGGHRDGRRARARRARQRDRRPGARHRRARTGYRRRRRVRRARAAHRPIRRHARRRIAAERRPFGPRLGRLCRPRRARRWNWRIRHRAHRRRPLNDGCAMMPGRGGFQTRPLHPPPLVPAPRLYTGL